MAKKEESFLKFNFDVSAYRLLGRELITDRITALFELVKNSYDSNANDVTIEFININPINDESKIIISDDGFGMDFNDVKNRWMVIGTSSKRRERKTPEPYNRIVSGKKGIGRFAVDKLGAKLVLKTKKKGANKLFCLETDWVNYSKIENSQMSLSFEDSKDFFTDIKNRYWLEDAEIDMQGTTLEISRIENEWSAIDIKRAYKELSKLISPNNDSKKFPFYIKLKTPFEKYKDTFVKPQLVDFSTLEVDLNFDLKNNTQEKLLYKNNELTKINIPIGLFGPLKLNFYYFNQADKNKYKSHFKTEIDGIKIYRDGLITTPFAEYGDGQNDLKDILGLDKRRWSGFFDRLGTRDLLGYIEISDERNPLIFESTNRQGFVENVAWLQLKTFVIEQIQQIEYYLKSEKIVSREKTQSGLKGASVTLKDLKSDISKIKENSSPELKEVLLNIENNLGKLQGTVNKSITDFIKLEEETKQKENLFFSLVSLQSYAAMFSHMTQHTIGHLIRDAEYFSKNYALNTSFNERFVIISKRIFNELLNLRNGVEFMLKYAKSETDIEEIHLEELLKNMFYDLYSERLRIENVNIFLEIDPKLIINYNRKAIEDIFDNLITNSIKALKGCENKIIKCTSEIENNGLIIYFSDNGLGIEEEDKYRVFDIFFTKTADEGGAGMGLYVVKTRIEAMQGTIEVIENELKPKGATFKITLPFKK